MRFSILAVVAAAASVVSAQSSTIVAAPQATDNVPGVSYHAQLPEKGTVRGSISAVSGNDGKGVFFKVSVSGLPAGSGPFMYHIHEKPVPADGNCTGAGAHLDPYKRGEVPACDSTKPETCQTGDLSGKYGNFTASEGSADFLDLFLATNPANPSFFGNLSFVVHLSNKTRVSCANFTLDAASLANSTLSSSVSSGAALPTGTGITNTTSSGSPIQPTFTSASPTQPSQSLQPTSGAERLMVAGAGILAGAFALAL